MPKQGMKKVERMHTKPCKDALSKAENHNREKYEKRNEWPISSAYPVIDTDLARDNLENDLTSSDKQDL